MSVNQVALAWTLMALQGGRRLYESLTLTKPSESKMWVGLWGIGIAYYIAIGVSVWIEGIPVLNATENPLSALKFSKPSLKTFIAVPLFVLASGVQHDCHEHLARLKKYTLPWHPHFQRIVCPHYTSECLIYIAIAVAAAPKGHLFNRTMLAGLCFVTSNLAVTADSTRKWYIEKFGADQLKGRWRMVPFIY
ncbi:3-oxo-5-alpha-steroid 4-dehydrogenase protein [Rutstroemia sp. NJR-2017a WRK4]|nr:3-oxo-5-alpha-steroid 4-dehydrogenase protein [Rutstroemia sp. NJR-2017a WRK4]